MKTLIITTEIHIPRDELRFTFVRSSGPGGQNVNKVNSKAVLRWAVASSEHLPEDVRARFMKTYRRRFTEDGDLVMSSQRYRDQQRNVADCLEKLRSMILAIAKPPKKRKVSRPSRGAVERRLQEKRAASRKKESRRPPSDSDD